MPRESRLAEPEPEPSARQHGPPPPPRLEGLVDLPDTADATHPSPALGSVPGSRGAAAEAGQSPAALAGRLERTLAKNGETIMRLQAELMDGLAVPDGWTVNTSRSTGFLYYVHTETAQSQYSYPAAAAETEGGARRT